ncbi:MAG: ferrous iron transporter B, partial [Gemmatimonadetes bacterium]|nr:ferrous iron transporter B [Gemmatimonadota bacterium]
MARGCAPRDAGPREENLVKLGLSPSAGWDHVVALAGNPNTGKSTVFNALTGLRQHTGNWPGKTVTRAEGTFAHHDARLKVVDMPGTYSLLAASPDEEVARDFLLFGRPDVTVVVVDATRLERNLNLVLQILEITDRVVVCLNLMDEARRRGVSVDPERLERQLGVPVVATVARRKEGIEKLLDAVVAVARGEHDTEPRRVERHAPEVESALDALLPDLREAFPSLPAARWVALRLLSGDESVAEAVRSGEIGGIAPAAAEMPVALVAAGGGGGGVPSGGMTVAPPSGYGPGAALAERAEQLRWRLPRDFHDRLVETLYAEAHRIADASQVRGLRKARFDLDRTLDRLLTSKWTGFPVMLLLLTVVFWLTIAGSNVPSSMLASLLVGEIHPALHAFGAWASFPWWLSGFLFDGLYLATAWVVSVMLPPMAIFFPLFTLLEDFGYLPRVAFNMDALFRRAGAHGKQALTMCMGFGCNAAGVVS